MPLLMNTTAVEAASTASAFGYSGKRIDDLDASEYTLASIAVDVSSSVCGFKPELDEAYQTVVRACRRHPRAEHVLCRGLAFSGSLEELHGFVNLSEIEEDRCDFRPGGWTALYDAALASVESVAAYGRTLADMDYLVNAICFVVTDGEDTGSKVATPRKVRAALEQLRREEFLESVRAVLIGVGDDAHVQGYLDDFKAQAGFDQFVWTRQADPGSLAQLAEFISRSIGSVSQSLGTGVASSDLSF